MTDKQIVDAAKASEKKTEFGELVHSQVSRGVNSAYGIGFLEGAEWAREQIMKEAVECELVCLKDQLLAVLPIKEFQWTVGDKVRVIIVKED